LGRSRFQCRPTTASHDPFSTGKSENLHHPLAALVVAIEQIDGHRPGFGRSVAPAAARHAA